MDPRRESGLHRPVGLGFYTCSIVTFDEKVHNAYVKTLIDTNEISKMEAGKKTPSSISYIDLGQARLYPSKNLIHGDTSAHYGLELCLASVQMLMNHPVERDRQNKLMIHPWLSKDLITTRHGYNDTEKSKTIGWPVEESLIKPEKIEALKNAKASFCDDCMCSVWSMTETCHDKVELMFYGIRQSSMLDVLVSAITNPVCNKSSEASYIKYYISFSKVTENEKLKKK